MEVVTILFLDLIWRIIWRPLMKNGLNFITLSEKILIMLLRLQKYFQYLPGSQELTFISFNQRRETKEKEYTQIEDCIYPKVNKGLQITNHFFLPITLTGDL